MEQVTQTQALMMLLMSLKKDMDDIKKRIDGKTPLLLTEEAVEGFKAYLEENAKPNTRRSIKGLLAKFEAQFPGANIAEIPPLALQEMLAVNWGKGKRSTLKLAHSHLKWFYAWSIKYTQKKGLPPFPNPCDFIEVKPEPQKEPQFIPPEKMWEFLSTAKTEAHWLIFAILMTAGLRASELIGDKKAGKTGLLKRDIDGRVLAITTPKSGKAKETAVIPSWVEERLRAYIKDMGPDERVFKMSYGTLYDVITTHACMARLSFGPHYLRKWIASYWQRLGEYSMVSFVLRHSTVKAGDAVLVSNLGARYVAGLSSEEVTAKQDELLKEGV